MTTGFRNRGMSRFAGVCDTVATTIDGRDAASMRLAGRRPSSSPGSGRRPARAQGDRSCDICGGVTRDVEPVTADDRARNPALAAWIARACRPCRRRTGLDRATYETED